MHAIQTTQSTTPRFTAKRNTAGDYDLFCEGAAIGVAFRSRTRQWRCKLRDGAGGPGEARERKTLQDALQFAKQQWLSHIAPRPVATTPRPVEHYTIGEPTPQGW